MGIAGTAHSNFKLIRSSLFHITRLIIDDKIIYDYISWIVIFELGGMFGSMDFNIFQP